MNKKEAKQKIKELQTQLEAKSDLSQFIEQINRNVRSLKRNKVDVSSLLRDHPEFFLHNPYHKETAQLRYELDKLKYDLRMEEERKEKQLEESLESFYHKSIPVSAGTTEDRKKRIIGISRKPLSSGYADILIYVPGYTAYVDRMTGSSYSTSRLYVVKSAKVDKTRATYSVWDSGADIIIIAEGLRLTPRELIKYEDLIKEHMPDFVSIVPPKGYFVDYAIFKQSNK